MFVEKPTTVYIPIDPASTAPQSPMYSSTEDYFSPHPEPDASNTTQPRMEDQTNPDWFQEVLEKKLGTESNSFLCYEMCILWLHHHNNIFSCQF